MLKQPRVTSFYATRSQPAILDFNPGNASGSLRPPLTHALDHSNSIACPQLLIDLFGPLVGFGHLADEGDWPGIDERQVLRQIAEAEDSQELRGGRIFVGSGRIGEDDLGDPRIEHGGVDGQGRGVALAVDRDRSGCRLFA